MMNKTQRVTFNNYQLEEIPKYKPMKCNWCHSFLEKVVHENVHFYPSIIPKCIKCKCPLSVIYVDGTQMKWNDSVDWEDDTYMCRTCFEEIDEGMN